MSLTASCCISHKITQERTKDIKKAAQLVEKIRTLGGLTIQDRTYHLRRYKTCFVASELVDWFVRSGEASSRAAAIELGQLLVNVDYIHHVVDEHNFEDAYLFFRFRQDEPPESAFKGPSVAYLRGQEGVLISLLAKKRLLIGWTYYVYILLPGTKKLYQYRTELESNPLSCVNLSGYSVQPESPPTSLIEDRGAIQRHILHFYNKEKVKCLSLSADSGDLQLSWLHALEAIGVEVLPAAEEVEDLVKNAKSIYEFEAKDIDGNATSMEIYRGHVTLIVNVASA